MATCRSLLLSRFPVTTCKSILTPRNLYVNFTQNEFLSRKAMAKLGLPQKPKKPMSPFFQYMMSVKEDIMAKHKTTKPTEITKIVAVQWKDVDDAKKKELQHIYDKEMVDYIKNIIKYEKSLTLQQRDAIKEYEHQLKIGSEKKLIRNKLKELNKPKKPVNSFMQFMAEERSLKDPNMDYAEWFKSIGEKWKAVPENVKEKYVQMYKSSAVKYKKAIDEWEQKMIRMGHTDVVRQKNLYDSKSKE